MNGEGGRRGSEKGRKKRKEKKKRDIQLQQMGALHVSALNLSFPMKRKKRRKDKYANLHKDWWSKGDKCIPHMYV